MPLIAVMTVEVGDDVTDRQWEAFCNKLGDLEWERVGSMSATWCGAYEDGATEDDAVAMAMDDVADAAEAADIAAFDAIVHFGPNAPSVFSDEDYEPVEEDGPTGPEEP